MLVILLVIISLGLIIFFHEFGHFILSKIFGVDVEEFGFGYAPRMLGFVSIDGHKKIFWGKNVPRGDKIGTIYSLNWIPFGGFNRLKGEEPGSEKTKGSFQGQIWWRRSIIALGGAGMNIILAIILFSFVSTLGLYQEVTPEIYQQGLKVRDINIQIIGVEGGSPADQAGLKIGDKILTLDGQNFFEIREIQNFISNKVNQPIEVQIKRNKNILNFSVIPRPAKEIFDLELEDNLLTDGAIGIAMAKVGRVYYPWQMAIISGFSKTFILLGQIFQGFYLIVRELFVHQKMIGEAVGVVGLAVMIGDAAQIGFVYLLQFLAVISLLLAATQVIPIPALDGGRLLFCLIEGIRGKPINPEIENKVNSLAFVLLLVLMVYITYKDLMKLGGKLFK